MDEKLQKQLVDMFQTKLNRVMKLYLETCARCGVCNEACHAYASTGLSRYTAARRAEVVRRIYKKYFKLQGKLIPVLGEGKTLDDNALEELKEAAWSCTGCRRCVVYCPLWH
jgi:Fe-S oxidoreductase